MGADIHAHVEVKIDGKWEYLSKITCDRWYNAFAWLSGVRSYSKDDWAFKDCRSLYEIPLSKEGEEEYRRWGSDAHSITVIHEEKLRQRFAEKLATMPNAQERKKDWEDSWLGTWVDICAGLKTYYDDVRVVMWYDN